MPASIIIPCYNGAATLNRALASCVIQDAADEILVVDDGSTDCTADIVKKWSLSDARVTLLQMPVNSGPAQARNWGALQARCAVLAFLDADDEYFPTALVDAVSWLSFNGAAAVRLEVEYAGFPVQLTRHPDWSVHASTLSNTVPSSLVIRRSAFLALGGFPVNACFRRHGGEDGALSWCVQEIFGQSRLTDRPRVRMHWHPEIHAERFLRIQMGLDKPDVEVAEQLVRESLAVLTSTREDVRALCGWVHTDVERHRNYPGN